MDRLRLNLYDSNMEIKPTRGGIPSYNLFGESSDLPDVIHCETIAARSTLHEWEFTPHRHARLHQLLLIQSGGGTAHLENSAIPLESNRLVNVPAGHVHAFTFVRGTQGLVLTMACEMLDEVLARSSDVRRVLGQACVVDAADPVRIVMAQLADEYQGRSYARAQVLRGLCAALLGLVSRTMTHDDTANLPQADSHLLTRFEALIEAHYLAHWRVGDYARELAVTPTHLSRVVRLATGQPASRLIDDRMIREARRNLVYTNLQVGVIAYALGFSDPAYFSRFFSRATGHSPRSFRDHLAARTADSSQRGISWVDGGLQSDTRALTYPQSVIDRT